MIKNKILIITHYSKLYGANNSLLDYILNSHIAKERFIILCPNKGPLTEKLTKSGIQVILCWFPCNVQSLNTYTIQRWYNSIKRLRFFYSIYKVISAQNPQLIYTNSSVIYYGFMAAKLKGIPHIWHIREFGYEDYKLIPDGGHSLKRYLLKLNSFNIAISKSIAHHYNLNTDNCNIVYNGVVKKEVLQEVELSPFDKPLRFGVVGLITSYKNQLKLLEAFHEFNRKTPVKAFLYLTGQADEHYLKTITDYIDLNNLSEYVKLTGHIDSRKDIYNAFDILLNGAEFEGFGRVTIEAMSFGKIPIGLNHSGTAEVIKHNITGIHFDTFEELPGILNRLNQNRHLLRALQKKMLKNFPEVFTIEDYCRSIDQIILENI